MSHTIIRQIIIQIIVLYSFDYITRIGFLCQVSFKTGGKPFTVRFSHKIDRGSANSPFLRNREGELKKRSSN